MRSRARVDGCAISNLYKDDILLWSAQQAELLGRRAKPDRYLAYRRCEERSEEASPILPMTGVALALRASQ
jgi:hypothetical protein